MKNYRQKTLSCWLLGALLVPQAFAQDNFNTQAGNFFELSVDSELGTIDNFFYDKSNEQSTSYLLLSPSMRMQTQFERQLLSLNTKVTHIKYGDYSQDDHSNFVFSPSYQFKFADNKALFFDATWLNSYELRGTGLSLGDGQSLNKGDERESARYSFGYLYGSKDSVAKFQLAAGGTKDTYQTRRAYTRAFDRNSQFVKANLDYLLSGQSYLATELKIESTEFANNSLQNKDKYTVLAGLKWQTTTISQFSALIGYQNITFDESLFDDDDAFKWRFDVFWHPIEVSRLSFRSERDFEEANRISNSYRVVDNHHATLAIDITEYFKASSAIGMKKEKIISETGTGNEQYIFAELELNYQRNDWLSLFVKYSYNDLDAKNSQLDHQRNSISFGFNVSI